MSEDSLVIFTKAEAMLAEADTVQKAKELKSLALTAADWARRKGMGEKAILHCRSYALEAERKMGQMLKAAKESGQLRDGRPMKTVDSHDRFHLAEADISKDESSRAQQLTELPDPVFEQIKSGEKSRTQARRELQREAVERKVAEIPRGKYRVLYADPPWKYGDDLMENYGSAKLHYPCMTISELCALPIAELAHDDAVLFLWVTSPILPESFDIIRAWKFTYKASFVWDKVKHNMGHYNSVRHEFLLICTRGSCLPDDPSLIDSVQSIERTDHSRKPEEFRRIIESLYLRGERLELFARSEAKGWHAWGNEVDGTY